MSTHRPFARIAPAALAAAAFLVLAAGQPAMAEPVGCETIDLSFDTGGREPSCEAGKVSGRSAGSDGAGGWAAAYEGMVLDTSELSVVIQVHRANRQTYMVPLTLRESIDGDPWFSASRRWMTASKVEGYEVQRFEGTWDGAGGYWTCAGFMRYSRPVAVGGAGYREKLKGAYCVAPEHEISMDELSRFLTSIEY